MHLRYLLVVAPVRVEEKRRGETSKITSQSGLLRKPYEAADESENKQLEMDI